MKMKGSSDLHGAPWLQAGVGGVHLLLGDGGPAVAGEQAPAALPQVVQHGCTRRRGILTECHQSAASRGTKRLNGSGTVGQTDGGEAGAGGRRKRRTDIIWMLQVLKTIILLC